MTDFVVSNITVETSGAFEGFLDMTGNNINNVADGVLQTDGVNLGQVETLVANASGNQNLQSVTDNGNTTTNGIVVGDDSTFQQDLTVIGDLYVQGTEYITNTEIISGNQIIAGELHVDGDSYLGNANTDTVYVSGFLDVGNNVDFNNNKLLNVAQGTDPSDGVNLGQVETLIAAASGDLQTLEEVLAEGNSAGSYDINMNNNSIINLDTPVNPLDATNKVYVDTLVASVSGADETVKNGTIAAGSFSGNPKKATVTFGSAFPDATYSISITAEARRVWSFENKTASGFTINANANRVFAGNVDWIAAKQGAY